MKKNKIEKRILNRLQIKMMDRNKNKGAQYQFTNIV